MIEQYLTEDEVAERLRIKVSTLKNWRHKGIGPRVTKVGAWAVRYKLSDVLAFVEAGR